MVQVAAFNQHPNVVAYPDTPLPYGTIPLRGSAGGLSFPLNVRRKATFTMLDGIFNRPLNISFTGDLPCHPSPTALPLPAACQSLG